MTVTAAVACVLASTALHPLYIGTTWFAAGTGAVITVAAAGALTRLRTLPVVACLAASVAALLLYLNLVFEARHSLLLVIPTSGSLSRLWALAGTGMHDANRYAPPAPGLPGLLLLAAGGVGITAVFTDLIAVRLRSTALAGLPLLVLFTVPVMMNASHDAFATGLVFCMGTAGYLAMLSADGRERIRVWGRLISLWRTGPRHGSDAWGGALDEDGRPGRPPGVRERRPGPDTRTLAAKGRRVGLASIVLALCAPLLLPGLHPSKVFSSGPGIGGDGGGTAGSLTLPSAVQQTVTQLHENHPTVLFTYTTSASAAQQDGDAQYFRQYVFDTLAGGRWEVDNYGAGASSVDNLPNPQGLTDSTTIQTVTTKVTVGRDFPAVSGQPTFLPLPYPPIHIYAPGTWLFDSDEMVYSAGDSIAGQSYSVASVRVDPSRAQLEGAPGVVRTASMRRDLQLPASYQTAALKRLAASVTAGQTTEFGKVDALANWLSGGKFRYSLAAKSIGSPAGLLSFLTKTRSGFCVQYAYAMTVLTRLVGIPARFVGGYTAGTRLANGSYQVKTTDAHAWTEVYFPSLGWIRFEPTPAGQGTANSPNYMTGQGGRASGDNSTPIPGSSAAAGNTGTRPLGGAQNRFHNENGVPGEATANGRQAGTPWPSVALAVIAAILLALGLITILNPPGRRLAPGQPAQAARHRRPLTTTAGMLAAAAALLALALYRLLGHVPGLDIKASWATVGIVFGATAAAVLITPGAFRLALRRWRWMRAGDDAGRAHAAWREFHDDLADFGVACRPSEPPRTLAARVTATLPEPAATAVTRIALAEERASYAARPAESAHLRRDGTAARRGLAATARRSARWRAALFPASMLTTLAETASRIPDQVSALRPRRRTRR